MRALLVAMLLTGCARAIAPAPAAPTAPRVGDRLSLTVTTVDGRQVSVSGAVHLVYFWASWCAPCKAELPHLRAAYEQLHPAGFEILGISVDDDREQFRYFVEKEGVPWPQHFDGRGIDGPLVRRFGIEEIPVMWLVDRRGVLRDVDAGSDLAAKARKLLAE